jgi:hypothetical protein
LAAGIFIFLGTVLVYFFMNFPLQVQQSSSGGNSVGVLDAVLFHYVGKENQENLTQIMLELHRQREEELKWRWKKHGAVVPETSDSSWLPNFGSAWQSGSRKELRKDTEKNHKLHEKNNPELTPEIKPYVSKRMVNVFSHFLVSLFCMVTLVFRILVC